MERFTPVKPNLLLKSELRISGDDLVIGSVCRLVPQKRVQDLVEIAPTILSKFPSTKFLIVGDGPLRSQLEALVVQLGLAKLFRFTGFREDREQLLSICDVFVQLADREGFGLSMVEAMACGIPVVAARSAPIPEIVNHNVTGIIVEIGDVDSLSKAVCSLLGNLSLREQLSAGAVEDVRQRFAIRCTVKKLESLYQKFLNN